VLDEGNVHAVSNGTECPTRRGRPTGNVAILPRTLAPTLADPGERQVTEILALRRPRRSHACLGEGIDETTILDVDTQWP